MAAALYLNGGQREEAYELLDIRLVAVPPVPDASFGCRELEPTLAKMVDAQRLVRHPYDNRHLHLRLSPTFIVLAGIAVVALTSSTLQADPIEGLNAGVFADRRPAAERIVYRRCWWRNSEKHCRRHRAIGYVCEDTATAATGRSQTYHRTLGGDCSASDIRDLSTSAIVPAGLRILLPREQTTHIAVPTLVPSARWVHDASTQGWRSQQLAHRHNNRLIQRPIAFLLPLSWMRSGVPRGIFASGDAQTL